VSGDQLSGEPPTTQAGAPELEGLREVADPRALRALAHPVRIALLEALWLGGPMTATEVGERIGESPTTCSFHLRQLAKYNFVEEAGGGKGRARPWRMTAMGIQFSNRDDPEADLASKALARMFRERTLERYRTWLETQSAYPREWQSAAGESEFVFWLTPAELDELRAELLTLLFPKTRERFLDPSKRPARSVPVEMLIFCYPVTPPATD
jgi:DNA-binding transcriptional ArsR family regulator